MRHRLIKPADELSRSVRRGRYVKALLGAILLVAFTVGASTGYVVILKSGQRIRAREPFTIKGKEAIIVLVTGTLTAIPLDKVDIVATQRYNKLGLGNALTVEGLEADAPRPTPTPRRALGSYVTLQTQDTAELGSVETPTPTPTPGIKLQNRAYPNSKVDEAFKQVFDQHHLYLVRTSIGTRPEYYFVQAVTDSEAEVFNALKAVAAGYKVIHDLQPELAPEAVELQMVTTSGKPAGTFRMSLAEAQALTSGKVGVESFYVKNVIF
jgi:hypothetical protein